MRFPARVVRHGGECNPLGRSRCTGNQSCEPGKANLRPAPEGQSHGVQEYLTALFLESHGRYRAHVAIVVGPRRCDPFCARRTYGSFSTCTVNMCVHLGIDVDNRLAPRCEVDARNKT